MSKIDLATAQKEGLVVGLNGESGIVSRREIDDLMVNDPDCFNLYILALERIMRDEGGKQDKMNYYQVAGIHGLPLIDWDGVSNPTARGPGSYCTHASFLFPSWHRPYLGMMEQTLYSNMKDIATKFDDPKYQQAVKRFRLPFWDWIKPREKRDTTFPGIGRDDGRQVSFAYNYDLPAVLQLPTLRVFRPESQTKLVDIANPLLKYTFPKTGSIPSSGTGSWASLEAGDDRENRRRQNEDPQAELMVHASHNRTVRNPDANFGETDDFGTVNQGLNMMRASTVINALNLMLLKDYDNYLDFASEAPFRSQQGHINTFGSLEDIHNRYHGLTGGDGHMGRVPVAAFDPVFWLHHCNIDRMLTIWQASHSGPSSYLPAGKGTFGRDLQLWPFRKDGKNSFWNSADVQDHTVFGYTYADVKGLSKKDVLNRWDQSYRWSLNNNGVPPDWMKPIPVNRAQALQFTATAEPATPLFTTMATLNTVLSQKSHSIKLEEQKPLAIEETHPIPESKERTLESTVTPAAPEPTILDSQTPQVQALLSDAAETAEPTIQWYVDVEVKRDAFNGAFTIFYFLAPSPAAMADADRTPRSYSTSPYMAGLTHVFTAPTTACDACNVHAEAGTTVTGTAPITPMLRDYVLNARLLEGLAPEQVVPFLKKNLYVRVKAINNVVVPHEDMEFLTVGVTSVLAARRDGEGRPVASETKEWPEVMESRRVGDPVA